MTTFHKITTGYKKYQRGQKCEDFARTKKAKDFDIMAVADGHSDSKCVYARRGAELAVKTAINLLYEQRKYKMSLKNYGVFLNEHRESLIKVFIKRWVGNILVDYKLRHPENEVLQCNYDRMRRYIKFLFREKKEKSVDELNNEQIEKEKMEKLIYPITMKYGTTLNVCVVSKAFVFAMGIGDGDVVVVNNNRVEWLLQKADRFEVSPPSLCKRFESILNSFGCIYVPIQRGKQFLNNRFNPELVFMATDGFRNSFLSDEEFSDKILEIKQIFKKKQGKKFLRECGYWISELSRDSIPQDDISFCLSTKYDKKCIERY